MQKANIKSRTINSDEMTSENLADLLTSKPGIALFESMIRNNWKFLFNPLIKLSHIYVRICACGRGREFILQPE